MAATLRLLQRVDLDARHHRRAVKALLVSFYFPPAGGGGVQRPLKLAQYLPALGVETHVLAPDDPRWVHRDDGLRLPTQAWVHRARYLGPSGGSPAEVLRGTEGLARAAKQVRLLGRRLLVPDESVGWNVTAIPAAIRLVREHGIDWVITTSPPGSVHLVGAAVQRATPARWLADLRDSLAFHPHRRADTVATRAKERLRGGMARLVASRADAISCVSEAIADEMRALEPRGPVRSIANGSDFDDFAGLEYEPAGRMRITHAGSFFGKRDPRPFLQALERSGLDVVARFVGDFRPADREWAESIGLGDRLDLVPYAPRATSLALQRDSEALLLLIPDAGGRGRGVLSGKVFEYLAAGRPILAVVPPDGAAAELIRAVGAGPVVAPDDVDGIRAALVELHGRFADGGLPDVVLDDAWRRRLSRRTRVEEIAALMREVGA
jgi:glycosyltransferase involved in cell wall biosynthesis